MILHFTEYNATMGRICLSVKVRVDVTRESVS